MSSQKTATNFTPKLDRIIEESFSRNLEDGEISDAVLDEYEVLTEQDLLAALDINPRRYKEGEYLNGVSYKDDADGDDTDGEYTDDDGIDGLHSVSNGHIPSSPGAFVRMHSGAQARNIEIMERFRGGGSIGSVATASRERLDQMVHHNDDVMSVTSDSSSLSKVSKRRKISGQSSHSHFFMMKTGDCLLYTSPSPRVS